MFREGLWTLIRGGEGVLELGWGVGLRFGHRPVLRLEVLCGSLSRGHRSRTVAGPVSVGSLVNVLGEASGEGWVMEDKTEHGEVDGGGEQGFEIGMAAQPTLALKRLRPDSV